MPRYYFHLRNDEIVDDEEGRELPDIAAARECAIEAARELTCASIHRGRLNLDHYIEVVDAEGEPLFRVAFREAFIAGGTLIGRRLWNPAGRRLSRCDFHLCLFHLPAAVGVQAAVRKLCGVLIEITAHAFAVLICRARQARGVSAFCMDHRGRPSR